MRISKKAVIEAVKNNRTEDVSEVLEEFGLFKPPTFPFFTAFIYTLLSFPFLLWLLLPPGCAHFSHWGIHCTRQPSTAPSS